MKSLNGGSHYPSGSREQRSYQRVGTTVELPILDRDYGGSLALGTDAIELDRVPKHVIDVAQISDIECTEEGVLPIRSLFGIGLSPENEFELVLMKGVDKFKSAKALEKLNNVDHMATDEISYLMWLACGLEEAYNHLFDLKYGRTIRYFSPILTAVHYWNDGVSREKALRDGCRTIVEMIIRTAMIPLYVLICNELGIPNTDMHPSDMVRMWITKTEGVFISMGSFARICLLIYAKDSRADIVDLVSEMFRRKGAVLSPYKTVIDTHNVLNGTSKPVLDDSYCSVVVNDTGSYYEHSANQPIDVVNNEFGIRRLIIFPKRDYYGNKLVNINKLKLGRMRKFYQERLTRPECGSMKVSLLYSIGVKDASRYYFIGYDIDATILNMQTVDISNIAKVYHVTPCGMFVIYSMLGFMWRIYKCKTMRSPAMRTMHPIPFPLPVIGVKQLSLVDGRNVGKESTSLMYEMLDIFAWTVYSYALPKHIYNCLLDIQIGADVNYCEIWDNVMDYRRIYFCDYEVMSLVQKMWQHPHAGKIFIGPDAANILRSRLTYFPSELTEIEISTEGSMLDEFVANMIDRTSPMTLVLQVNHGDKPWLSDDYLRFYDQIFKRYPELDCLLARDKREFYHYAVRMGWIVIRTLDEPNSNLTPKPNLQLDSTGSLVRDIPKILIVDFPRDKETPDSF
jgi:hypothetical protein